MKLKVVENIELNEFITGLRDWAASTVTQKKALGDLDKQLSESLKDYVTEVSSSNDAFSILPKLGYLLKVRLKINLDEGIINEISIVKADGKYKALPAEEFKEKVKLTKTNNIYSINDNHSIDTILEIINNNLPKSSQSLNEASIFSTIKNKLANATSALINKFDDRDKSTLKNISKALAKELKQNSGLNIKDSVEDDIIIFSIEPSDKFIYKLEFIKNNANLSFSNVIDYTGKQIERTGTLSLSKILKNIGNNLIGSPLVLSKDLLDYFGDNSETYNSDKEAQNQDVESNTSQSKVPEEIATLASNLKNVDLQKNLSDIFYENFIKNRLNENLLQEGYKVSFPDLKSTLNSSDDNDAKILTQMYLKAFDQDAYFQDKPDLLKFITKLLKTEKDINPETSTLFKIIVGKEPNNIFPLQKSDPYRLSLRVLYILSEFDEDQINLILNKIKEAKTNKKNTFSFINDPKVATTTAIEKIEALINNEAGKKEPSLVVKKDDLEADKFTDTDTYKNLIKSIENNNFKALNDLLLNIKNYEKTKANYEGFKDAFLEKFKLALNDIIDTTWSKTKP